MRVGAQERAEARGDAFHCACLFRRDDPTDIGSWPRCIDLCGYHAEQKREIARLRAENERLKGWLVTALAAIADGDKYAALPVALRDWWIAKAESTKDSSDYCLWKHDHSDVAWATDCGAYWQFTDGGPRDNGVIYCHKCGKPVNALDQHDEDCDCDLCGETEKEN